MRVLLCGILLLFSSHALAAQLTVNNVPVTAVGGTTPKLKDSSITSDSAGNVGIGTTDTSSALFSIIKPSYSQTAVIVGGDTALFAQADNSSGYGIYGVSGDGGAGIEGLGNGANSIGIWGRGANASGATGVVASCAAISDCNALEIDVASNATSTVKGLWFNPESGLTNYDIYADGSNTNNYFAGNVGIGSTFPAQKLSVVGTVKATAFIGDGSGLSGISSGWTDQGTSVVLATSTDNVGIGTFAPLSKLQISNGSLWIGDNLGVASSSYLIDQESLVKGSLFRSKIAGPALYAINGYDPGAGSTASYAIEGDGAQSGTGGYGTGVYGTGQTGVKGYATGVNASTGVYGQSVVTGGTGVNGTSSGSGTTYGVYADNESGAGAAVYATTGNAAVYTFYGDSATSPAYFRANVGIGTLVPGQKLDVSGTARATAFAVGANVGIGTSGATCSCTRYQGGICTAGSCT